MLYETVLYLLMIGVFAIVVQNTSKYDGCLTSVLTGFTVLVFYLFLSDWHLGTESVKTFAFQNAQSDNLKLDIISQKQNYALIFPFFISTLLALFNNLFLKLEKHKKRFLGLLIFNLIAFIMLISGNNLIQLMTFVFVIDIISCLLIENVNAAKRYSLYNLVSDMGLFLVLSMIQGKLVNLDVGNISHYYETGHHRDFIMFVVMLSLFIKFGLVLFQGYWSDLKNAKFHRLYFLPYLSTPMAALILFIKFYPILVVSPSFLPLLNTMLILSMLCGAFGAVFMPSIKEKFVYLNMLQLSLLIKLIEQADFLWRIQFSDLLIFFFVFNLCLYALHKAYDQKETSNKMTVICLMGSFFVNSMSIFLILGTPELISAKLWIVGYMILFLGSLSYILNGLYSKWKMCAVSGQNNKDFRYLALMIGVLIIDFYFCRYELSHVKIILGLCICFAVFVIFNPFRYMTLSDSFVNCTRNTNFFSLLYKYLIVSPLKHAGVLSNIVIDFIFLERTLWPSITKVNVLIVKLYRLICRQGLLYYALCSAVGIGIMLYVLR